MADINFYRGDNNSHPSRRSIRNVYCLTRYVKGADVVAKKGSALANGDVIKLWQFPADTVVLFAGFEVVVADTGSDVRAQLGTDVDPDQWVAAVSIASTGVKTAIFTPEQPFNAANTIDLTIDQAAAFNANGNFEIQVWAILADIGAVEDATSADAATNA